MKSITYIKRNLTNLNRSILSQLLQSEGVELTDGLWNYLTETPWNTNWRLLEKFGIDIDENSEGGSDMVTVTFVEPYDNWSADDPSSYEIRQMETDNPMTVERGTTITLPHANSGAQYDFWYENSASGTRYEGGTEFTVNANVVFGAEPSE